MKKKTHPPYQEVLFEDTSTGTRFICGSTMQPKEKATYEGKEYPICRVPISSASHPFFTGSKQFLDTEGRVEKFTKRYQKKKQDLLEATEKVEEKVVKKKRVVKAKKTKAKE